MAIVLPHGVLFRGGAEEHIRKYLIETRNYLDAVIGLRQIFSMAHQYQPAFWSSKRNASMRRIYFLSMQARTLKKSKRRTFCATVT
jgi:hypothetical protein